MSLEVDEHREYLSDRPRLSAFRSAIEEVVKPNHVVLDLGCGTAILGLLACRAGAKRVYAIDEGGMIELARAICGANGFQDRVRFIKDVSSRVELPERVDVVLADQIGQFGFEAGLFEYFGDARRRFLKPGGVTIPRRLDLYVCPIEFEDMWKQVDFWNSAPAGFDFRPARSLAANTGYPVKFNPGHLLGTPEVAWSVDPSSCDGVSLSMRAQLNVTRPGILHGIGGWFVAQLSPHVTMSNSPLVAQPINRRNVFFPHDRPVAVQTDDRVFVSMRILPTQVVVSWNVEVWRTDPHDPTHAKKTKLAQFSHSTLNGMLISREDLQRTKPASIPTLNPWGQARLTVLTLCDGLRPLADIEREVLRQHPNLFPSLNEAATFVAEVVTRYAR
ncbi:MAG: class I SAM-dependent methyltransferase [Nitrospirota bacterium]